MTQDLGDRMRDFVPRLSGRRRASLRVRRAFSDEQERDESGRWTSGGGGVATLERPAPTRDPTAAGRAVAALAREDMGHAIASPSRRGPSDKWGDSPWGTTTISAERHAELGQESIKAMNDAGFNGALVAQAAEIWSSGTTNPIRGGGRENADEFLAIARENEVSGTLVRGVTLDADVVSDLRPGSEIKMGPSSWSRDPEVAEVFTRMSGSDGAPVVLVMDGPAHGLDIAAMGDHMFAWQQEVVLVDPYVKVVSVERPDPMRIYVDDTIVHVTASAAPKGLKP